VSPPRAAASRPGDFILRRRLLPLAAGIALLSSLPALRIPAQDNHELESIEAALSANRSQENQLSAAAAALAREIADLQYQLVARAAAVREAEGELARLRAQQADLQRERASRQAELAIRRQDLALSLTALVRLASTPPGAALASASPLDVARGEMLLGFAVPELQRRVSVLERDIAGLDDLEREIDAHDAHAEALSASLAAERRKIEALLTEKSALQQRTAEEAAASEARSVRLAAQARDLRDLLDRLAKERAAAPAPNVPVPASIRAFPLIPGSLVLPVVGPIVGRFGMPDGSGSRAKGILIQAEPGAAVLAPFDGQIVFRGPFRSYGEILIIQHGDGYHSLLAGLGRSDAAVGQWVLAGEPVGVMGPPQDGKVKLYVELRRDGHPIDPAPWLGKSDTNVE